MEYPKPYQFIYITNSGAHYAASLSQDSPEKSALQVLLKSSITPKLPEYLTTLKSVSETSSFQQVINLFSKGYISAKDYSTELKEQSLDISLPKVLAQISSTQECTLCDQEGFLISYSGFNESQAEQASALAIEICGLQKKRQHSLNHFSASQSSFISIADKNGNTTMQFLPLNFKQNTFFLAIQGKALTQLENFTQLIWLLGQRYL